MKRLSSKEPVRIFIPPYTVEQNNRGHWSLFESGKLRFPLGSIKWNRKQVIKISELIIEAFESGRFEVQNQIRNALGIPWNP
jgi:hypothetical protein